jgi:purine catabolism regulator
MPAFDSESNIDQLMLEQGASAIAISLLNERVSGARSAHHQGILVNRLMLGDISGNGFLDRALRIGKDLRNSKLIIVVIGSLSVGAGELEREVGNVFARSQISAVTADIGDAVLSVVALRGDRSLGLLVKALSDEDRVIGFSKIVDPDVLGSAVEQAKAAFSARQACKFFDQLGLLRLLVPLSHGPELAGYVEDELGSLLAYDSARHGTLLPTLEAYLECDGNKTNAAKKLFIQRRTLYYRLEKMSQILGLSLDDGEVRLRLRVAVRALELLRSSPHGLRTGLG